MKVSGWKQERLMVLLFVVLATITALLSGYWAWSFLAWMFGYVIWKILEFNTFYRWYMKGASKKRVPINNGVFEALTCQVIANKNKTKEAQKRSKYLLHQFVATAQALPFATLVLNDRYEIIWANLIAKDLLDVSESDAGTKIDNIIREPMFIKMMNSDEDDREIKLAYPIHAEKSLHLRLIKINKDRYLLVARDISAQEALQKSRKAFVANASHELRTPLTVIAGYLEMMQGSGDLPADWDLPIDQAAEQAQRMEKIIADMLKLSRIEHDRVIESKDELIEMPELLNIQFRNLKSSRDAAEHELLLEVNSGLKVRGMASEITSVCLNLMHNAIIHTDPGTRVTVKWFEHNGEANFWVEDNGHGIDAKHLPHLTERFYRVDNARDRNVQSTGLGLAIVKHICLKHGAKFDVESQKGQGTCFKVIFPEVRTVLVE